MDIISFLTMLENTLNQIDVKGQENLDRLLGCIIQTRNVKAALMGNQGEITTGEMPTEEMPTENVSTPEGGEVDGGQSDITTDASNGDTDE